jgi:hypothetical protein
MFNVLFWVLRKKKRKKSRAFGLARSLATLLVASCELALKITSR